MSKSSIQSFPKGLPLLQRAPGKGFLGSLLNKVRSGLYCHAKELHHEALVALCELVQAKLHASTWFKAILQLSPQNPSCFNNFCRLHGCAISKLNQICLRSETKYSLPVFLPSRFSKFQEATSLNFGMLCVQTAVYNFGK